MIFRFPASGLIAFGFFLMVAGTGVAAEPAGQSSKPVTFAKDIAPIFQEKCQDCHRKGAMAPMSLVTYEESRPWAKAIKQRVVTKQMPPWHIDQTIGVTKFKNDMSLSQDQIKVAEELNYDAARGPVKAPLLLWGPYLWGAGTTPRKSDGLVWLREDLSNDGTHPSDSGRENFNPKR